MTQNSFEMPDLISNIDTDVQKPKESIQGGGGSGSQSQNLGVNSVPITERLDNNNDDKD